MISVLILTLNEERNLPRCLDAVRWSDDVVVLDSGSQDSTVKIAKAAGARVLQRKFDNFAAQRNFGLLQGGLKHDWVFHIDADEIVPEPLRDEAQAAVRRAEKDAFQVPSKMIFQGRWLKHAGLYPSYQVRLGRRDKLTFTQVGHGQREALMPSQVGKLVSPLLHYSFSKGLYDWFEKHNRYSTDEAARAGETFAVADVVGGLFDSDPVARRRAIKQFANYLPCRPFLRFLYMFVLRRGFLDGSAAYHYCRLLSLYEYMTVMKIKERRVAEAAQSTIAKNEQGRFLNPLKLDADALNPVH